MSESLRLIGVTKRELTNITPRKDWPVIGINTDGRPAFVSQAAMACLGRESDLFRPGPLVSIP